ncbi:YtxH domain-containing protein [Fulvivirga sp. M361]|uniref:YtxH domain-containing protein n=1 Tax=Fulvivirga sp. M361 TaxID=2594266 RepID=UPI00117A587A|nr:YtxH domain-containing protein [Fulvivirga sp. M361]TRX60530.1 YtxH domain-containing protein [Fulvivirga sp. M361]
MNDTLKCITGFVAGAAIGYSLSLLIAPEEGAQLRKRILDEAEALAEGLINEGAALTKQAKETMNKTAS